MRRFFFHSFIALLFAAGFCSCRAEGPVSDITIHQSEEPRNELESFVAEVTDGIVEKDALTAIPQLVTEVKGKFVNDLFLCCNVDGGESVIKGPVEIGRPVRYDLDWKVWTVGEHTVSGRLVTGMSVNAGTIAGSEFSKTFTITAKEAPVVEDDFLVSIVHGNEIIPLRTTETASVSQGGENILKIDFKGKGEGKVNIKNLDYTFTVLEFSLKDKFEGEGLATVPFKTLQTGTAAVTVTFTRGDKTYKPTFRIDVNF